MLRENNMKGLFIKDILTLKTNTIPLNMATAA